VLRAECVLALEGLLVAGYSARHLYFRHYNTPHNYDTNDFKSGIAHRR
jgi:hypothetical protein